MIIIGGEQRFVKSTVWLKIQGAKTVIRSASHTEDPQILVATVKKKISRPGDLIYAICVPLMKTMVTSDCATKHHPYVLVSWSSAR